MGGLREHLAGHQQSAPSDEDRGWRREIIEGDGAAANRCLPAEAERENRQRSRDVDFRLSRIMRSRACFKHRGVNLSR